ncbi:MAG: hypothetical protein ACFFA1_08875 [Promethearchaeota archaeon]
MAENLEYCKNTLAHIMKFFAGYITASIRIYGDKTMNILAITPGREMGKDLGERLDRASTVQKALEILSDGMGEGWKIELWKDSEQPELITSEDGQETTYLNILDCPVRQMCNYTSLEMGAAACNLAHAYIAMGLETILERKIKLKLETPGPNACKMILSIAEDTTEQ